MARVLERLCNVLTDNDVSESDIKMARGNAMLWLW